MNTSSSIDASIRRDHPVDSVRHAAASDGRARATRRGGFRFALTACSACAAVLIAMMRTPQDELGLLDVLAVGAGLLAVASLCRLPGLRRPSDASDASSTSRAPQDLARFSGSAAE